MNYNEELALEEYRALRKEIDTLTSETRSLVRISLTGVAAIYAWLASNVDSKFADFGWFVPVAIVAYGILISLSNMSRVSLIASYIAAKFEAEGGDRGWEVFLAERRTTSPIKQQLIGRSYTLVWAAFLIGTIFIAFWMTDSPGSIPVGFAIS